LIEENAGKVVETLDSITHAEVGCPQCGAPVRLPHEGDFFRCASCGSTLVLVQGSPAHVLREHVGVTREQASGILEAWLAKQAYVATSAPAVGEVRFVPFLRVRTEDEERVVALVAVPSPAVARLAHAPAELVETEGPVEGLDRDSLRSVVAAALDHPDTRAVQVEIRAYYPARYAVAGQETHACSAVVGAGQGTVYPDTLPARSLRSDSRLRWYLLGLAVALIVEAVAVPGVWQAVIVIVATAAAFCCVVFGTGAGRG
jgi:hypothetical protein